MAKKRGTLSQGETEVTLALVRTFHECGLCLPTRTVYLGSGEEDSLDAYTAAQFVCNVELLTTLSSEPITVVMNCPGGDEYHGLACYDAVLTTPCEVTVRVRGHAMSMGSVILQAADRRVMGPSSTQMVHYGRLAISHHAKTAQKIAAEGGRLDVWMEQVYLERIRERHPRFSLDRLRDLLQHDTYLDAAASVELGLADEVG